MPWSPSLRVSFTDEELVAQLASSHDKPEERKGNWFTFFSNLPVPERQRLEAAAAAQVGAAAPPRAARQRVKPVATGAGAGAVSHAAPSAKRPRHPAAPSATTAPPAAATSGDADETLADLLNAARELTESARQLSQQMNELASRIRTARSARTP